LYLECAPLKRIGIRAYQHHVDSTYVRSASQHAIIGCALDSCAFFFDGSCALKKADLFYDNYRRLLLQYQFANSSKDPVTFPEPVWAESNEAFRIKGCPIGGFCV